MKARKQWIKPQVKVVKVESKIKIFGGVDTGMNTGS